MRDALGKLGITAVELQVGSVGQFDIFANDKLVYSRASSGRFPSDAEIAKLKATLTAA